MKVTANDGNGGSISDEFDIVVSTASAGGAHCDATDANELWCVTLTVATWTAGGNTQYGYAIRSGTATGSVAPDSFPYRTATILVGRLSYADVAGSRLRFVIGRNSGTTPLDGLLGASHFSLEIGTGGTKKSFAIDNPGTTETFQLPNHGLSWTSGDTVPVKLLLVPAPPRVANHIPNQRASADEEFSYRFPANTFADVGDTPAYTATKADDSALSATWLSFDAGTRTFSGTPTSVGTLSVKLTATDTTSRSVSDTFDIVVSTGVVDQRTSVAEAFSYIVPANTFDGASTTGTLTYRATLADGSALASNVQLARGRIKPGWLRFIPSSRRFWGTPLPGSDGTTSVRVTATDARGKRLNATFDITVGVDSGLVGNFTRPGSAGRHLVWFDHAQKFTTGADAAGYTVTSIDVLLRDVRSNDDFPTVTIEQRGDAPRLQCGNPADADVRCVGRRQALPLHRFGQPGAVREHQLLDRDHRRVVVDACE